MKKIIFQIGLSKSKHYLVHKYSKEWYENFKGMAKQYLEEMLPDIPDIGKSIFAINYQYAPSYMAWYKAFVKLGLKQEEIDENIWAMNEAMMKSLPSFILHRAGRIYFNTFRKKAPGHVQLQQTTGVHPYDWQIGYRMIDDNRMAIDIYACGMLKLARQFGVEGLLPGICRLDYLNAHYMGNGFERTKTLADGDDCCNCLYLKKGNCEWHPEKGFIDRK